MSKYFYQRVSSVEQKLSRQTEAIEKWENENNTKVDIIFSDKQSGKDFERTNYQKMKSVLKADDLVIVKSIDRLGRDYEMIISEWTYITKVIKANILVLDMPLLDTRDRKENLTGKFISDLVLQILSYVAQTERENIKVRQKEGIACAKKNGVKFGRKEIYDEEFIKQVKADYDLGMKINDIAEKHKVSRDRIMVWKRKYGWVSRRK